MIEIAWFSNVCNYKLMKRLIINKKVWLLKKKIIKVIELGAGTGYVGLTFAKIFAQSKIWITEMSKGCLLMIDKSIEANELKERCVAKELYWGKEGV